MKEKLKITSNLKQHDRIELPMEETFYNQLHDKIMTAVDQTEIKSMNRWSKAWVLIESKSSRLWRQTGKGAKNKSDFKSHLLSFIMVIFSGLSIAGYKIINKVNHEKLSSLNLMTDSNENKVDSN